MNSNNNILPLPSFPPLDITKLFQIQLDEGSQPDCAGTHRHSFYEIIFCRINCGAEFQLLDTHYQLRRGDIILIPPEAPHTWLVRSRAGEPYMGYRLCMDAGHIDFLRHQLPDFHIPNDIQLGFIRTQGTVWEQLSKAFQVLYEEMHFRAIGWEAASMASSVFLMTQLGRAIACNPNTQVPQAKADLLEVISNHVKTHLGEKITLEDIAQKFWVSPSTVTHLFNKKLGTSFYKYVTTLRLNEAKNLITEGMPMEKIALRVGFGDYSAFYRAFKKEFGISPRQYMQSLEMSASTN